MHMMAEPTFVRAPANATEKFQTTMCNLGLATPSMRFASATMATATGLIVLKPDYCYNEDGEMRKFKLFNPKDPNATHYHFFLVPLLTGLAFAHLV